MPKSKKPRKPKSAAKHGKGPKTDQDTDAWNFTQQKHGHGQKPGANISAPMHNRQPPKRGA